MAEIAFPTIADVNETLSNVKKLVEDRNALINFYFGDDIYKDFLLAERLQDIAEADRRDDRTTVSNVNLDQTDVYQEASTFKRFSNFLNPGDLRDVDLDPITPGIMGAAERAARDAKDKKVRSADEEKNWQRWIDNAINRSRGGGSTSAGGGGGGSNPSTTRQASGGLISGTSALMPPVPSVSAAPAGAAPGGSQVESLKEAGFTDYSKNISEKLDESLDIDGSLKKALASAVALPLRSVASGLMDLMASLPIHTKEQLDAVSQNINYLSNVFGLPKPQLQNAPSSSSELSLRGGNQTTTNINNNQTTSGSAASSAGSPAAPLVTGANGQQLTGTPGSMAQPATSNTGQPSTTQYGPGSYQSVLGNGGVISGTGGGILSEVSRAPDSLKSSFTFNPSMSFGGDMMKSSSFNTSLGLGLQNMSSNSFGTNAPEFISKIVSLYNNPSFTENVSSIADRNPDLLDLTNQLEMDIIASQEEKTKFEVQSFAQATQISSPSAATSSPSYDTDSDAEVELSVSPFFDVYARTSQFA